MADTVNIGGVNVAPIEVDLDDPCAAAKALRQIELQLVTGGGVVKSRFGDDEVQWSDTASSRKRLQELIDDYTRQCAAKQGIRTRYAKRLRFVR